MNRTRIPGPWTPHYRSRYLRNAHRLLHRQSPVDWLRALATDAEDIWARHITERALVRRLDPLRAALQTGRRGLPHALLPNSPHRNHHGRPRTVTSPKDAS